MYEYLMIYKQSGTRRNLFGERARRALVMAGLIAALGVASIGCSDQFGFQVTEGQPVFVARVSWQPLDNRKIVRRLGAEAASLQQVNNYENGVIPYAKDANKVFMGWSLEAFEIEECDPSTFALLTKDGRYAKDASHVYCFGLPLEGADPKTFRLLDAPFAIDATHAYAGHRIIDGADSSKFEVIVPGGADAPWFEKNAMAVERHSKSDPPSIWGWARDGMSYYYADLPIKGADYASFEVLNLLHAKDSTKVYYIGKQSKYGGPVVVKVIPGADPATFVLIRSNAGRDKNGEYVRGELVRP